MNQSPLSFHIREMGTETATSVAGGCRETMHREDLAFGSRRLPGGAQGLYLQVRTLRNVLCDNLCFWPWFIDQGTETGRNVSDTPKGALHPLFSQGSVAQDSADSDQALCPVLLLHSSRKESCFSS